MYSVFVTDVPICEGFPLALPFCQMGMDLFVGETDQQNSVSISNIIVFFEKKF